MSPSPAIKNQNATPKTITRLSEVAEQFDAFIIDLWGVLHDGTDPYPGAIECLKQLKEADKEIILLSNAPRRAIKAETRLGELGFDRKYYHDILTSGEVTYRAIKKAREAGTLGDRYFYIGPEKDRDILDGLELQEVQSAKEAHFTLATGFDFFGQTFDEKQPKLEESLAANLPLWCANPDRLVVRQSGEVMLCSGLMSEWYAEHGGKTINFGKPHLPTYDAVFELLATQDRTQVACIGDSLHTDIAGGNGAGIASILCAGGIHKNALELNEAGMPSFDALEQLMHQENAQPSFVLPQFVW